MSAAAARRRRRWFAIGFRHLARICGGSVQGGRPLYRGASGTTVADAIERERAAARREMQRKVKKVRA